MTYVEWLRVRNVLRVTAIVLGVVIAILLIARIAFSRELGNDDAIIAHVQMAPGSTVRHVTLPDGTPRTIIDDPNEQTHVTIDNLGYGGRHIVIVEPHKRADHHNETVSVGSVQVLESANGKTDTTIIDTNGAVPFFYYMAMADIVALIIATCMAAPFARENDGHLEVALTRPASRIMYGVQAMGVDIVAIVGASVMTIVAFIICQSLFEIPHFDFSGVNTQAVVMGIAVPLAWYGALCAATASMKRGYGAVLGFAWPVAILIAAFAAIPWGNSLVGQTLHGIFWFLSRFDPLTYASLTISGGAAARTNPPLAADFGPRLAVELLLFVVYSALALIQWKRVEA